MVIPDAATCYRALSSRDSRFDGWFYAGITSTGIYCRPSCPARTPRPENCRWFASAAAAQLAGFRACRRCHPDAVPGSPVWRVGADVAARAMRLIADGLVDRVGVSGLAARLGFSQRQLQRLLVDHTGATALALARSQRAHTARVLLQTTPQPVAEVAFQSGFGSVRQFNDTIRAIYGMTPSQLRASRPGVGAGPASTSSRVRDVSLRLAARQPFDVLGLLAFLATRVAPGLESGSPRGFARTMRVPRGQAVVLVEPELAGTRATGIRARVALADWRDLGTVVARLRTWFDLDADPVAVDATLAATPLGAELVDEVGGIRLPGTPDAGELAVRCLVGQQISLQGAVTVAATLVAEHGDPLEPHLVEVARGWGHELTHVFPSMDTLAGLDPEHLPMPRSRGRALIGLAEALATGQLDLGVGVDRTRARHDLQQLPGIGPWTGGYVALRALGDPDVLLDTDLVIRRELSALGLTDTTPFSPWRSYLTLHLWRRAGLACHDLSAPRTAASTPTNEPTRRTP